MKVLLVEDNPRKRKAIKDCILNSFPEDVLEEENSLISGLRKAKEFEPNFVILDMSLPNHPFTDRAMGTADMLPFAGKEFLRRVRRMYFPTKVLVVSMFETFGVAPNLITLTGLSDGMKEKYPNIYLSAVHYSPSEDLWRSRIIEYRNIVEGLK